MKRLIRVIRWMFVSFAVAVATALVIHLILRPNPDIANAEQYAVFSAYLEPNLTGDSHALGSRKGLVVIAARTTSRQYMALVSSTGHAKDKFDKLGRSLVFEFWASNLSDTTLASKFMLDAPYELATDAEMKLWPSDAFIARFPDSYGAVTFSRVAFNRELTEAFFYTEHLCGLCGEGKFVYMRKTEGKWAVADTASMWIS